MLQSHSAVDLETRQRAARSAHCVQEGCIDPSVIRTDTTVECNVHYPTDSSLLWDTWRVASRILQRGRKLDPASVPHRFHDRKTKKLYLDITRYIASKSKQCQRLVKQSFRDSIETRDLDRLDISQQFCDYASGSPLLALAGLGTQLADILPAMKQVVAQAMCAARRRKGASALERVYSIFEPHTELIKRGRRHKPVEFGHAVLLCQTREKFITDYDAFEHKPADCNFDLQGD